MVTPTKPSSQYELAQTFYRMAYFTIPNYLANDSEHLVTMLQHVVEMQDRVVAKGALMLYLITVKMETPEGQKPNVAEVPPSFTVHIGDFNESWRYYVLEYPTPIPIPEGTLEENFDKLSSVILAPYFSAIVENLENRKLRYFILGQSLDGHTTLRSVSMVNDAYKNSNLGPGCQANLPDFLELLRERVLAGT